MYTEARRKSCCQKNMVMTRSVDNTSPCARLKSRVNSKACNTVWMLGRDDFRRTQYMNLLCQVHDETEVTDLQ